MKIRFIPLALDQWYQRRQKDAEGDFYRSIATQGPRKDMNGTTQGFYAFSADGKLLGYNNNRDPNRVKGMIRQALKDFQPAPAAPIAPGKPDPRFARTPPEGGLIVDVTAKVLGGYEKTDDRGAVIFQNALARDHLWVRKDEVPALAKKEFPESLKKRMARFHLVDNTRGEPPMWTPEEIRKLEIGFAQGHVEGKVHLETESGDRGYEADLFGSIETKEGRISRFDVVVKGEFWGEGRYTGRGPKGKFPFAVAFTLADGKEEDDKVSPQGARDLGEYLR